MESVIAVSDQVSLAYESFGPDAAPAVLLIMGLGAQRVRWPDELCLALVAAGFRVISFDNRDCGQSTHLSEAFDGRRDCATRRGPLPRTDLVGARLHVVPGMGHDVPPALAGWLAEAISGVAAQAA